MSAASPGRYEGRPFLRVLDSYVLWAAGELEPESELLLVQMTPKLQEVYGSQGSWQQIVEHQMDLPSGTPLSLKAMWDRNVQRAAEAGDVLDAGEWARQVVDHNFVS